MRKTFITLLSFFFLYYEIEFYWGGTLLQENNWTIKRSASTQQLYENYMVYKLIKNSQIYAQFSTRFWIRSFIKKMLLYCRKL